MNFQSLLYEKHLLLRFEPAFYDTSYTERHDEQKHNSQLCKFLSNTPKIIYFQRVLAYLTIPQFISEHEQNWQICDS